MPDWVQHVSLQVDTTTFKIQVEISLWQQVQMEPIRSVNCLSIRRLLKQPSKVFVRYGSQYLFGNFFVNRKSVAEFI